MPKIIERNNISKTVEEIQRLEKLVHYHNRKYFIDNEPEISDEKFDALTEQLRKLKPDSPILFEIVGQIGNVTHKEPILSIEKKYTYADIKKWINEIDDTTFLIQPKYDGMRARYQNGILATRGNGYKGENITGRFSNLNIIGTLPKNKSEPADGEIIIPLTYFNKNLKDIYKNPRNAVVGIIKSKKVKPEGIQALLDGGVHFVLHDSAFSIEVKKGQLLDEEEWKSILEEILQIDYPLDGVVIKVRDKKVRQKLGSTQHHYKWEIAYKVPAERKWSKVVEIKEQVGRTGRITSIAVIKPLQLSGATVTNVTLHNFNFVKKSKIGIGSKVEVTRSGEVIPFITKVENDKNVKAHTIANKCPVCNKKVTILGKYLECTNLNCPARLAQSFEYFFKTLDVKNLGIKTVERIINEFKIKNVIDFYNLKETQIAQLDGFGEKSANKIVKNIQDTLKGTIAPSQLLQALGIKEVGSAASKWILNHHRFDNLPNLNGTDLKNVYGVGPKIAENFINDIKEKWWIVKELKKRGLKFKKETSATNKLKGLKFAITGSFENYTRNDIIKLIEKNGGEYKASATKNLDYLIVGKKPGTKTQKIPSGKFLSVEDLKNMI